MKNKCAYCGQRFERLSPNQKYCSSKCRDNRWKRINTYWETLTRDNFQCQYCGKNPTQHGAVLHIDHIKPRDDGGSNDITNLVTACERCNAYKGNRSLRCEALFKRRLNKKQIKITHQNVFDFFFNGN